MKWNDVDAFFLHLPIIVGGVMLSVDRIIHTVKKNEAFFEKYGIFPTQHK